MKIYYNIITKEVDIMAGTSWYVSECKDCVSMDLNDRSPYDSNQAWCSERREYINPNSRACSNRFINDDYKNPPSLDPPCYLTTIVCEILGYSDDCKILNTLRIFREEILKKDIKYHDLLCEYDIVGPVIAQSIRACIKPEVLANFLLITYIYPTVECIENKKYELAVNIYKYMVEELKKLIGISKIDYDKNKNPLQ